VTFHRYDYGDIFKLLARFVFVVTLTLLEFYIDKCENDESIRVWISCGLHGRSIFCGVAIVGEEKEG